MTFAKNFARNYEKQNTWNIRRLVNEKILPSTQCTIQKMVEFQLLLWGRLWNSCFRTSYRLAFAHKSTYKIIEWILRKINNHLYLFFFLMSAVEFKAHFLVKSYKSLFYNFCFADASVAILNSSDVKCWQNLLCAHRHGLN